MLNFVFALCRTMGCQDFLKSFELGCKIRKSAERNTPNCLPHIHIYDDLKLKYPESVPEAEIISFILRISLINSVSSTFSEFIFKAIQASFDQKQMAKETATV